MQTTYCFTDAHSANMFIILYVHHKGFVCCEDSETANEVSNQMLACLTQFHQVKSQGKSNSRSDCLG